MKVMRTIFIAILSVLMVGCTSKPKHNPIVDTINNSIGINDTLGLSLHPEYPVYSTRQKQVTFVLHNKYLQPIITQYFIDNKSEIWLLFLIAHSKR